MIDSARLPEMIFLPADGAADEAEVVALSSAARRVQAIAAELTAKGLPRGAPVGLVARSGSPLVLTWLATLVAGLEPLIIQYPTAKQTRAYWLGSVEDTVARVGLCALIADAETFERCPTSVPVLPLGTLVSESLTRAEDPALPDHFVLDDYAIIQLSSGTTGHRKAIRFTGAALARHVTDFNETLTLTADDRIVSWLPLYHDMGYVACFVMPLILGVPVVMMDPMTWVGAPERLFAAITAHRGTVVYMPNFGYEVMARHTPGDVSSMRWWISCSEPVSAATCAAFEANLPEGAPGIAPCYAMAENIFAMTLRRGIKTRTVEGADAVSNGPPIKGVAVEVRGGEIFIKSPTALEAYMGGDRIIDDTGFYPTGDMGALIDGELFVAGRKHDLVIQAGRKFMLSDIDLVLNRLDPSVKGRGVACVRRDDRLGTEAVTVLIEAADFYARTGGAALAAQLKEASGVEQLDVAYVPPRFLTKTSSGKFNRRRSMADYLAAQEAMGATREGADPLTDLRQTFAQADWGVSVGETLDSLSLTMLRVIVGEAGLLYDPKETLNDVAAAIEAAQRDRQTAPPAEAAAPQFHIVSLADRGLTGQLRAADLKAIGQRLGRRVTFEHLCLPPSPVLLSDLIFHDWLQPRVDGPEFAAINQAMARLRRASLVMTDDVAELYFPPGQVYSALSHALERDPRTDLVSVRWQRYPRHHHELPMTLVAGSDLPLENATASLAALERVIGRPLFRVATLPAFAAFTKGWDLIDHSDPAGTTAGNVVISGESLAAALAAFAAAHDCPPAKDVHQSAPFAVDDLAHYCSHYVNQEALDRTLPHYERFALAGQPSSVPYIAKALEAAGKSFTHIPAYTPEWVASVDPVDVVLACGTQGRATFTHPTIAVMAAGPEWRTQNVTDPAITALTFQVAPLAVPPSGTDWFYPFAMARHTNLKAVKAAREAAAAAAATARAARLAGPTREERQAARLQRQAERSARLAAREERLALRDQRLAEHQAQIRERAAARDASTAPESEGRRDGSSTTPPVPIKE